MNTVILIAGATSMIGRACAHVLCALNTSIILLGRSEKELLTLAQEVGRDTEFYVIDFTSEDSINRALEEILKKHRRIDVVIHNVAIYPWKSIENLSLVEWQESLTTNLTSAFLLTKAVAPSLKRQKSGKIIYISSIAGEQIGLPYMASYAASKAGLNGLMRSCAIELAPFNINVNAVSPGKTYDPSQLTDDEITAKLKPIPLGRFVHPDDIAHMVQFLISNKGANITGQNFVIDGGQTVLGEENHILKKEK